MKLQTLKSEQKNGNIVLLFILIRTITIIMRCQKDLSSDKRFLILPTILIKETPFQWKSFLS